MDTPRDEKKTPRPTKKQLYKWFGVKEHKISGRVMGVSCEGGVSLINDSHTIGSEPSVGQPRGWVVTGRNATVIYRGVTYKPEQSLIVCDGVVYRDGIEVDTDQTIERRNPSAPPIPVRDSTPSAPPPPTTTTTRKPPKRTATAAKRPERAAKKSKQEKKTSKRECVGRLTCPRFKFDADMTVDQRVMAALTHSKTVGMWCLEAFSNGDLVVDGKTIQTLPPGKNYNLMCGGDTVLLDNVVVWPADRIGEPAQDVNFGGNVTFSI